MIAPCLVLALIFGIYFAINNDNEASKEPIDPTELSASLVPSEPISSEPLPANPEETISVETEPSPTEVPETAPEEVDAETEPEVTEPETVTVYSVGQVNIRSGPGTNYKKLGVLEYGESIERVEARDDGWSEVIYNNELTFISSGFLSETKPQAHKPSGSNNSGNTAGNGNNNSTTESEKDTSSNWEEERKNTLEDMGITEEQDREWSEAAKICQHCGGENGPYHRWIDDVTCPRCGAKVAANTCHYC